MVQPLAISPVHRDVRVMLSLLSKQRPRTALEIGCGTGYLSIELAKRGWNVTGTDIVPEAVEVSMNNAKQAGVSVTFVQSDMFQNLKGRFDAIIFNPPLIFSTQGMYPYARGLVARIPVLNNALVRLFSSLPNAQHSALMGRFFEGVKDHLTPRGVIYLVLFDHQLQGLRKHFTAFRAAEGGPNCRIVIIARKHLQPI